MQREGQLDHAQVGAEVAAVAGDRGHQEPPDLGGQIVEGLAVHVGEGARRERAQDPPLVHDLVVPLGRFHDQWVFTRARMD